MTRAVSVLVPLALVVAACGGDGGGPLDDAAGRGGDAVQQTDEPTGDDRDPTDAPTGDAGDRPDDTDAAAAGAADTVDPPSGAAGSDYCSVARALEEQAAAFDIFGSEGAFDPSSIRDAFDLVADAMEQFRRVAPDDLRADYATIAEGLDRFRSELADVDYNLFALDLAVLEEFGDEMDAASTRIETYNREVCGIEAAEIDIAGDRSIDPEDFDIDMGEFGELMREQMVQAYLADGYSQAEAECLAAAIFDFDALFDLDLEDPESFESFEDPFTKCGVEP